MNPRVSVIIPTYQRKGILKQLLQELLKQDYSDFEIIIVDQSPSITRDFLEVIANNQDKVKYVCFPGQNAARARNMGLSQASGEIIICCDDDVEIAADFIKNHLKNYADPSVGEVCGRVICANDRPLSEIREVGKIRKWDGKVTGNFNANFKTEVEHAYGCNVSYRKDLLVKAGGYDERLAGTGSFDDADVSFKIRKLGYKIIFEPSAQLRHLQYAGGTRHFSFAEQMYWYYHNFMIFYLKFMPRIFLPLFFLRQISGIIRRGISKRDREIILFSIKGIKDGFRDYAKKA
jgi:GT2 family glycosyltransferase